MRLHSTKYDGSLHYQYPVQVIERSADRLVTLLSSGSPIRCYRGEWLATKNILGIFRPGRPYVLHAHWNANWQPMSLYIDIASNVSWDAERVGYVDMDLDVIQNHHSPEIILDDEDEFADHRVKFSYPESLVAQCHSAVAEVRRLLELQQPPFTRALLAWRPGDAIPS